MTKRFIPSEYVEELISVIRETQRSKLDEINILISDKNSLALSNLDIAARQFHYCQQRGLDLEFLQNLVKKVVEINVP